SVDQYRFSVGAGDSIYVDVLSCPGSYYLNWKLVDDVTGAQKGSGGCGDGQLTNLAAGTYRLVLTVSNERTGAYSLQLFKVPPVQTFDVSLASPLDVSDQAPAAGAGNLETKASVDQYRFTLAAGQAAYVDVLSCPGSYYLNWKLVDDATGTQKGSGGCGNGQVLNLAAGTYRVVVTPSSERIGSYSMRLRSA
ncbi:MAG: hypothetical protein QOE53_2219, partial [Pseudonocardiales bacterium]|nr:hypothetical protein [Pseudonocardiales bacterium]